MLNNLIGNAIKFSDPGGSIHVRVEPRADEVCFSVTDSGPGIPEADLPHIFDRFTRASKGARPGTGLGLSIAKGIVEAHGGRIWAESQVGRGEHVLFHSAAHPFRARKAQRASIHSRARHVPGRTRRPDPAKST